MDVTFIALPTIDELRLHVHERLCARDHLDPVQTPLEQVLIVRAGKPCGLFFEVRGPRLQKTYALWAGEENRIRPGLQGTAESRDATATVGHLHVKGIQCGSVEQGPVHGRGVWQSQRAAAVIDPAIM